MKTHKNNKRPKKNGKKTRSKKQKGGTIFTPTTKEELKNAVMRWVDGDRDSLGNISEWNTSNITDMSNLFYELNDFNEDISRWDVSNVENMEGMFNEAKAFNQPIGNWKVSNVTNMADMFNAAKAFNQPIGDWDVSNVKNMQYIFMSAITFNQPIGDWNVSSVIDMECMFYKAEAFNQPIGNWNVSNVTNMDGMFWVAKSFNQPIGDWDVSNVTNMTDMFNGANDFNQPIGNWNVSNVTKMGDMFNNSGYTHEQPSVERSKQRIQDKQNLDNLHEDVVSNTKKLNMSESTRKVLSLKPEQGPGIENIKEFLGGKKVKKTHSKKKRSRKNRKHKKTRSKKGGNIDDCINDEDPITLETINEIESNNLVKFKVTEATETKPKNNNCYSKEALKMHIDNSISNGTSIYNILDPLTRKKLNKEFIIQNFPEYEGKYNKLSEEEKLLRQINSDDDNDDTLINKFNTLVRSKIRYMGTNEIETYFNFIYDLIDRTINNNDNIKRTLEEIVEEIQEEDIDNSWGGRNIKKYKRNTRKKR